MASFKTTARFHQLFLGRTSRLLLSATVARGIALVSRSSARSPELPSHLTRRGPSPRHHGVARLRAATRRATPPRRDHRHRHGAGWRLLHCYQQCGDQATVARLARRRIRRRPSSSVRRRSPSPERRSGAATRGEPAAPRFQKIPLLPPFPTLPLSALAPSPSPPVLPPIPSPRAPSPRAPSPLPPFLHPPAAAAVAALVALTGWNATAELCSEWPGVTCNRQGMVTKIDLQEYPISAFTAAPPGTLPADIGAFNALRVLRLPKQNISGPIPTESFTNLTSLRELDLSSNPLDGSLEFLAYLPSLQYLDLHATELTGEIPAALGNATALSYLSLGGLNLTAGQLPASLSALTNLTYLDLSYLKFASVPSWIAQLPKLQFLDVTAPIDLTPARSSPFPTGFTNLTSLNSLMAAGNGLSGSLPATISALTALSELDLAYNRLAGSIPALPSTLLRLSLSHNSLEGPIPSFAAPGLIDLDLSHNRLTGPIPATFTALTSLTSM
ncbi:unnamed protein product [Closterium sp. NIES-53]